MADIEAQMAEMQTQFDSSYKDLEKAKQYNDELNAKLLKVHDDMQVLCDDKAQLENMLKQKDQKYNKLMQEIDYRESEKEKIIDHIKKQAENAVAFYKNKYERKLREQE